MSQDELEVEHMNPTAMSQDELEVDGRNSTAMDEDEIDVEEVDFMNLTSFFRNSTLMHTAHISRLMGIDSGRHVIHEHGL